MSELANATARFGAALEKLEYIATELSKDPGRLDLEERLKDEAAQRQETLARVDETLGLISDILDASTNNSAPPSANSGEDDSEEPDNG